MPFEKGKSGNPNGRPSGQRAFIDRALPFLEEYTVNEIISLANDKQKFGELSVFDGMIVRRIVAAFARGGGRDMDSILDRVFGKPKQTVEGVQKTTTLEDLVLGSFQLD